MPSAGIQGILSSIQRAPLSGGGVGGVVGPLKAIVGLPSAYSIPCTVGWSALNFCYNFRNEHLAVDWLYFYQFNSKKLANFAAQARESFIFKKSLGPKSEDFFGKFAGTFLKHQRTVVKKKIQN